MKKFIAFLLFVVFAVFAVTPVEAGCRKHRLRKMLKNVICRCRCLVAMIVLLVLSNVSQAQYVISNSFGFNAGGCGVNGSFINPGFGFGSNVFVQPNFGASPFAFGNQAFFGNRAFVGGGFGNAAFINNNFRGFGFRGARGPRIRSVTRTRIR